jgi:hypothetical protein
MVGRLFKFCIGLLLLPLCAAVTMTLVSLIGSIEMDPHSVFPVSALAMGGGFLLWMAVFILLPRPVRGYVLAHELTHAIWGWLMGARVHDISVKKESGSVTLSKTNFLITLAPYFFPLYTVLAIATYYVTGIFWDVDKYHLFWLGLVGFTWSFHCTFTILTLMQRQSDIRECGRLFSYAVIYIFNITGVALWVVLVSSASIEQLIRSLGSDTLAVTSFLWERFWAILGGK